MTVPRPDRSFGPFSTDNQPKRTRSGSRNRLTNAFITRLADEFDRTGEAAIARLSSQDPGRFLELVVKLIPQKLEITTPTDGMSDERLEYMLEVAERIAALQGGAEHGAALIDVTPKVLITHEKTETVGGDAEGGGGRVGVSGPRTKNTPPTTPDRLPTSKPDMGIPIAAPENSGRPNIRKATPLDHQNATSMPHPVGRPSSPQRPCHDCGSPLAATQQTRCTPCDRAASVELDPSSLF